MSFVSNTDNIWEYIGNVEEHDSQWSGDNKFDDDEIEIQKKMLKKDAELLNQLILEGSDGKMYVRKDFLLKNAFQSSEKSDCEDIDNEEEDEPAVPSEEHKTGTISPATFDSPNLSKKLGNYIEDDYGHEDLMASPEWHPGMANSSDEYFEYILYVKKLKLSVKRNILKRNLSEDLTWADYIVNE
jgi:hypothetical protein